MIDAKGIEVQAGMNVLFDGEVWEVYKINKGYFFLSRFYDNKKKIGMYVCCWKLPQLQTVDVQKMLDHLDFVQSASMGSGININA